MCGIGQTFFPRNDNASAGGIPFLTRRYERLLLLIPYILVNLMPDFIFQHHILYQYTYGSTACLFYLAMMNYKEMERIRKENKQSGQIRQLVARLYLFCSLLFSVVCFVHYIVPRATYYPKLYAERFDEYEEIKHFLQLVPEDVSVAASPFFTVPLSNRDVLYSIERVSKEQLLSVQYVVFSAWEEGSYSAYADEGKSGQEGLINMLEQNDYILWAALDDRAFIYSRP